jgi:hypothetical protein
MSVREVKVLIFKSGFVHMLSNCKNHQIIDYRPGKTSPYLTSTSSDPSSDIFHTHTHTHTHKMKLSISAITSLLILLPSALALELANNYCIQAALDSCRRSGYGGCLVTGGANCVDWDSNGGCRKPCQDTFPGTTWSYWRYGANGYVTTTTTTTTT